MKLSCITAAIAIFAVIPANADVFLWPKPQSVEWGNGQLHIPVSMDVMTSIPNILYLSHVSPLLHTKIFHITFIRPCL